MTLRRPLVRRRVGALAPQQRDHEASQEQDRQATRQPYDVGNEKTVFAGDRIVVKTKEQQLIDRRADARLGGFDQAQTQIARRKIDAVIVARDFSCRRQEHDSRGVGELARLRIVVVVKPDRSSEFFNRVFGAGKKMPTIRGAGPGVARAKFFTLGAANAALSWGSKLTVSTSNWLPMSKESARSERTTPSKSSGQRSRHL